MKISVQSLWEIPVVVNCWRETGHVAHSIAIFEHRLLCFQMNSLIIVALLVSIVATMKTDDIEYGCHKIEKRYRSWTEHLHKGRRFLHDQSKVSRNIFQKMGWLQEKIKTPDAYHQKHWLTKIRQQLYNSCKIMLKRMPSCSPGYKWDNLKRFPSNCSKKVRIFINCLKYNHCIIRRGWGAGGLWPWGIPNLLNRFLPNVLGRHIQGEGEEVYVETGTLGCVYKLYSLILCVYLLY